MNDFDVFSLDNLFPGLYVRLIDVWDKLARLDRSNVYRIVLDVGAGFYDIYPDEAKTIAKFLGLTIFCSQYSEGEMFIYVLIEYKNHTIETISILGKAG